MKKVLMRILLGAVAFLTAHAIHAQKIGLLMGSFVSDRWYLDQKLFIDEVQELGGECLLEIAYDADEQVERARKLIAAGVKVIVVVPLDGVRGAAITRIARQAGVPIVCYDRPILTEDIAVFLSYDNERVGELQAQYMVKKVPVGKYFLINGPITDHNAILFREGQMKVLKPHIDSGKITIVEYYVMDNWSEINAFEMMNTYLQQKREIPDVILAANDALANGVIQALPEQLRGRVLISGQDADLNGVRNILAGNQAMTVYKPIKALAFKAAQLAVDLAKGKKIRAHKQVTYGDVTLNAIFLKPVVVDISNYKETVVSDGHTSLSEVLKNLGKAFEAERNRIQLSLLQKEKALERQQKASERNIFAMIVLFFIISLVGLSYTIFNKQKDNKLLNDQKTLIEEKNHELTEVNKKLIVLNDELTNQKEEIASQRDAIFLQKEKLEEVNSIIARQRDEIQNQNETLETEVQKRTRDLTQYVRQLEQYSFVTAHNLRAPVARIIGLCQLVRMHSDNGNADLIDKLILSSHELDLVFRELNAILDINTFSSQIFSQVNLEEEVESVIDNLKYEIRQNKASIETDLVEAKNIVSIKPYIHSILFNLISNSIKYRDPGRRPVVRVQSRLNRGKVMIVVSDNGLGIDSAYIDKVFQLYKRFHLHVEGRGVGLFLVKTQVDALGGNIDIESEVGKGTTFRIALDPVS